MMLGQPILSLRQPSPTTFSSEVSSMLMLDSISASAIPTNVPVVAGYVDGRYVWSAADWNRFPNAVRITIATQASSQADVLDVETGDATPADVPGWVGRFNRPSRRRPTIYCNRSTWAAVKAALGTTEVDYWISTLDGTQTVAGAVAVQYTDTGGYDESLIQDLTWLEDASLNQDTARGLVYDLRASLLGEGPGTAGEAAGIEAYVAGVVANVEGGLSALITDCQKDPRYLPARVAALEAKLAAIQAAA